MLRYLFLIDPLPSLGHLTADQGANVLYNHRVSLQVTAGKQPQTLHTVTDQLSTAHTGNTQDREVLWRVLSLAHHQLTPAYHQCLLINYKS